MDSQIEEIKNKLSVVDVIGSYLKLTKTGINYRGVCPFHSEKTPSFFVTPTRQMWHCFGCGAGSSMFDFIMKIEGVEFADALRILANKAGVELKRENIQLKTERQRLSEICELATVFYQKQLESSIIGKEANQYLLGRGITQESINKWRIGYSPDTWNSFSDFAIAKGYKREEVVKAGLAIEKEGGRGDSYDRFRGRIIFPVFDLNSSVVGFGGRVFKQVGETAKYINTPQTLLYDKSGVMYGLNNAKIAIRKENQCVVTEGYTDVIMCHQAGFENTVAASGTALTSQHLTILKRYTENLVLAFDMDVAGDSATKRGINLAEEQGFSIKIIESYGEGNKKSDPADIILKDPNIWKESTKNAKSIMDYYVDSAFEHFDKNTPEGKKDISKVVLPAIKRLQNKIEQSYWVQKLSAALSINEQAIIEELGKIKTTEGSKEAYVVKVAPSVMPIQVLKESNVDKRKKLIEERIVSLALKNPEYTKFIKPEHYALFSEKIKHFLETVNKVLQEKGLLEESELEKDFRGVFDEVLSQKTSDSQDTFTGEFKNLIAALVLRGESEHSEDTEDAEAEMKLCLLELDKIESKNIQNRIMKEITEEPDEQKKQDLVKAFEKEAKKFHSIT